MKGPAKTKPATKKGWLMFERLFTRREPDERRRDLTSDRMLSVRADTLDEAERSVEAVMSTDGQVTVFDWSRWGMIDEVLVSRGAELPGQVPLLENHSRWSLDNVLGSVRNMRAADSETVGRMFFAKDDPEADKNWNKVRQGHLDAVSVGYRAIEFTDIEPNKSATVAGRQYTAGSRPLRITTRWQVKELSLVPIGADPRAKIREEADDTASGKHERTISMDPKLRKYLESLGLRADATEDEATTFMGALGGNQRSICNVLNRPADDDTARDMQRLSLEGLGVNAAEPWRRLEPKKPETPPAPNDNERVEDSPLVDEAAIRRDEQERATAIREMVGTDADEEFIARAISENWTVEQAASQLLPLMRENRAPAVGGIHSRSHDTDCNARSLAAGMLIDNGFDPTEHRFTAEVGQDIRRGHLLTEQDADLGDEYRDMSAVDVCREACRIDGVRVSRGRRDAIRAATSGGTLSYVFGTNVYAQLVAGWEEIGDTTTGWCDEEDVPNFLTQEDITFDGSSRLEKLPRGDTAKHATPSDTRETYKIARYAKQFVMDEQDILDDRLGALMKMPAEMGQAARQLRPNMVYNEMLENPTMADTGAVFNSTAVTDTGGHANLGAAVLASAGLTAAITAMGKQRINNQVINVVPRYLIVPAALEWTADELTASETLIKVFADSSEPKYSPSNAIARRGITPVVDDRLGATGVIDPDTGTARTGSDTSWYLTAGGSRSIRVAYLRGTGRSPQLRSFNLDRGQWGLGWDIKHDLGVVFLDFRPWYKSTGAGA
jgi:hypothetical protein